MGGEAELRVADPSCRSYASLRGVSITVRVLDTFAQVPELGASEVARRVGISKSNAHRTLSSLAEGGLLEHTANGRYRLGLHLLELGQIAANRLALRRCAIPVMTALRNTVKETVQLVLPAGAEVYFLERVEGQTEGILVADHYRRMPAHASSSGKAMAAFNPEMAKACVAAGLKPSTRYTITEVPRYLAALDEVRRQGFSFSMEEAVLGWSSVAAPVLVSSPVTHAVAALSLVGASTQLDTHLDYLAGLLKAAAKRLADEVMKAGGSEPAA